MNRDLISKIIVVDDDSKDLTWKAVQEKFANEPRVRVLRRVNKKQKRFNSFRVLRSSEVSSIC